jgi:hypothetical protein
MNVQPPSSTPTDRPSLSSPSEVKVVGVWLYFTWGTVPALWLMSAPQMIGIDGDWLLDHLLIYWPVDGLTCIAMIFTFRGSLRGLWILRSAALSMTALAIAGLLGNGLVALGLLGAGTRHAELSGQFGALCFLLAGLPFSCLLLRGVTRVRWLDPRSLPEEWEPPMRRHR